MSIVLNIGKLDMFCNLVIYLEANKNYIWLQGENQGGNLRSPDLNIKRMVDKSLYLR